MIRIIKASEYGMALTHVHADKVEGGPYGVLSTYYSYCTAEREQCIRLGHGNGQYQPQDRSNRIWKIDQEKQTIPPQYMSVTEVNSKHRQFLGCMP